MSRWSFIQKHFIPEEKAAVSVFDLAVQRGYGVFDFFRLLDNQPLYLEEHLDRFFNSASYMRLEVGYTKKELAEVINELVQRNQLPDSGIRLTLTGGSSPDGMRITAPALIITQTVFSAPSNESITDGIRLMTFEHQRQLPHVKTIDYIMPIWLQPLIELHRVDDVLYCHNGAVTECPRSNFFIVTNDNKVVTAGDHILKGITRAKVIALAKQHFEVEERTLLIREVLEAKEAFITSTTKRILPVRSIDKKEFPLNNDAVSLRLLQSLEAHSHRHNHIP